MDIERMRRLLGAGPPTGTEQVTVYIPSIDSTGTPIDQAHWREETLHTLGNLFRGATAYPPGRGVWRNDLAGGRLDFEETCIVYSVVPAEVLDDEAVVRQLADFLRRFRIEARQGEVGLVVGQLYLGITEDPEE